MSSDGFSTTVQPAAMPGPTLRVIIAAGKFHGVMAPTTPTGCFSTMMRRSAAGRGDGVAIDALGFLAEPFEEGAGVDDLAARFGERLALLGRHQAREVFLVRDHQVVPFAHDLRAGGGGFGSPFRQGGCGGGDGGFGFGLAEIGDAPDHAARGGVADIVRWVRRPICR